MALSDIQQMAKDYAVSKYPEEWGPGKAFITKEHCLAQVKNYRKNAEEHFIAGATAMEASMNLTSSTKVTIQK